MQSSVLKEDLRYIADADLMWDSFRGKVFLVTGATGLVGSVFIRALLNADRQHDLGLRVIALVRNEKKAKEIFADEENGEILSFVCADICEEWKITEPVDFILHAAAVTKSKTMVEHPGEVIRTSLLGMQRVLECARENRITKMVYLSSMEMYGQVGDRKADETVLGYLDLSNIRSCYPESKRMCECMAAAWHSEFGVPVCSARLAQTFGPGILPGESRVFAQFAKSVLEERDIVLRTKGLSEGNYCYTRDTILALLILLLKGVPGEAYNVVNEESHMQIREMAQMVAEKVAGGRIRVVYDIPENTAETGYAPDVKLRLDGSKMRALGWQPEVGLEEAYRRLAADLAGV